MPSPSRGSTAMRSCCPLMQVIPCWWSTPPRFADTHRNMPACRRFGPAIAIAAWSSWRCHQMTSVVKRYPHYRTGPVSRHVSDNREGSDQRQGRAPVLQVGCCGASTRRTALEFPQISDRPRWVSEGGFQFSSRTDGSDHHRGDRKRIDSRLMCAIESRVLSQFRKIRLTNQRVRDELVSRHLITWAGDS